MKALLACPILVALTLFLSVMLSQSYIETLHQSFASEWLAVYLHMYRSIRLKDDSGAHGILADAPAEVNHTKISLNE